MVVSERCLLQCSCYFSVMNAGPKMSFIGKLKQKGESSRLKYELQTCSQNGDGCTAHPCLLRGGSLLVRATEATEDRTWAGAGLSW